MTSVNFFPLRSAFLALPLEDDTKWEFQALQEELTEYAQALSFQNPQTPHLTLQYWPELLEIEYRQVLEQAAKIASATEPFTLQVTGVNTFGSRGQDRVLFLEIAFSDPLARLKKRCPWPQVDRGAGNVPSKPFHPHITLARIKHPERFAVVKKDVMKKLKDISFEIPCEMIRLYAEVEGVRQTPLEDFKFQNSNIKVF